MYICYNDSGSDGYFNWILKYEHLLSKRENQSSKTKSVKFLLFKEEYIYIGAPTKEAVSHQPKQTLTHD